MSRGRDAIQFLPLVPGFANEQIKGLLQGAGWQEARQSCLERAQPVQGPFRFAGLCRGLMVTLWLGRRSSRLFLRLYELPTRLSPCRCHGYLKHELMLGEGAWLI